MHLLKDHFALDNDNKEPESSERKKKKKRDSKRTNMCDRRRVEGENAVEIEKSKRS